MYKIHYPEDLKGNPSSVLKRALQEDYNRELEWLWVADEVTSTLEREYCLRRALYINPTSRKAQDKLNKILKNRFAKNKHRQTSWQFVKSLIVKYSNFAFSMFSDNSI